ncbi:hypothetical protein Taro_011089 [Colocasia esculenta]|uniref:Uncharacterized protein n=1 Tax=Colocasia esculenta TaxID=4460 RepID=A0A843UBL9_COLES|nr:hypothetical protein [Colocasia esculenta]
MGRAVAKWWHHTELPFNAANSPYYKTAIQEVQRAGLHVARATTERGEYELDEEADDPEDPPRPNTFLIRAVAEATTEEEGDRGNVGQPYSPQFQANPEVEVNLFGDIELEHVERTIGGGHGHDDDDDFERLMEGLPRTRSLREAPSQSRRRDGSSSDGGGGGGGDTPQGGGGGDSGQGGGDGDSGQGGGGGGIAFTEEQFFRDATQDTSHGVSL